MSHKPRKCPECGHHYNPLLQYCPECETYFDEQKDQDIRDKYEDEEKVNHYSTTKTLQDD